MSRPHPCGHALTSLGGVRQRLKHALAHCCVIFHQRSDCTLTTQYFDRYLLTHLVWRRQIQLRNLPTCFSSHAARYDILPDTLLGQGLKVQI